MDTVRSVTCSCGKRYLACRVYDRVTPTELSLTDVGYEMAFVVDTMHTAFYPLDECAALIDGESRTINAALMGLSCTTCLDCGAALDIMRLQS